MKKKKTDIIFSSLSEGQAILLYTKSRGGFIMKDTVDFNNLIMKEENKKTCLGGKKKRDTQGQGRCIETPPRDHRRVSHHTIVVVNSISPASL